MCIILAYKSMNRTTIKLFSKFDSHRQRGSTLRGSSILTYSSKNQFFVNFAELISFYLFTRKFHVRIAEIFKKTIILLWKKHRRNLQNRQRFSLKLHQIVVLVDLFKFCKEGAPSITVCQDTGARISDDSPWPITSNYT